MTSNSKRGADLPQVSTICLDLDDPEQALEVGKELAQRSGRTVTVMDENGETLGIFESAPKH